MDGNRFDELTRGFGRSRRGTLKAIGAAALGAVGLTRLDRAEAGGGNSDCAHWCTDHFSGAARGKCTSDAAHGSGACYQCGPGAPAGSGPQLCNGVCTNTAGDLNNCGSCGAVCPSGTPNAHATCVNGLCGVVCNAGFTLCGGVCINTSTDPNNCGSCGHHCAFANAGGATCHAGVCGLGSCDAGFADCDGAAGDGCETNLGTDPNNCGGCGLTCVDGQPCLGGACVCVPSGCAGGQCGFVSDGCGDAVDCGSCPEGQSCDVNGICQVTAVICTVGGGICGDIQSCGCGLCITRRDGSIGCGNTVLPNSIPCDECNTDADCEGIHPDVPGVSCGYPGADCGCEAVTPTPGMCFKPCS